MLLAQETLPTVITIQPVIISFVVAAVIPFVHDLLTSVNASPRKKELVAAALSVLGMFLQAITRPDGVGVISQQTVLAFFMMIVSSRVFFKKYQALGVANKIAPESGIGKNDA